MKTANTTLHEDLTKKEYKAMCWECGKKTYTIRDEAALMGITVSLGECPVCKKEGGIVPASDWSAAEDPRVYAEKYD